MFGLSETAIYDMIRCWTMSISDFLDEYFENPVITADQAVASIIGTALGQLSPGTAYVLLHHAIGDVVFSWLGIDPGKAGGDKRSPSRTWRGGRPNHPYRGRLEKFRQISGSQGCLADHAEGRDIRASWMIWRSPRPPPGRGPPRCAC